MKCSQKKPKQRTVSWKTDELWESKLVKSIEQLTKSITDRTATLTVPCHIKDNIGSLRCLGEINEVFAMRLKDELENRPSVYKEVAS